MNSMSDSPSQKSSLIFLVGFMGSGKSTLGPILANTLGYDSYDIDKLIEKKAGKKIVDIFREDGEPAFRALERETLLEASLLHRSVVSLGGGTITNEENFQIAQTHGVLLYLKLSPEEIIQRVKNRNDRPMLRDEHGNQLQGNSLRERVCALLAAREPFYARADIVVSADAMRIGVTVDTIVKHLRELKGKG
jgi:shikimate kinase